MRVVRVLMVVALVALLSSGCEVWWSSERFDGTQTGFNPAERSLGLVDLAGLTPLYSAVIGAVATSWNPPIVARGSVYVATDDALEVYSADGTTGCTGEPLTCVPVWIGDTGGAAVLASPVVAHGSAFAATAKGLKVFDASGRRDCAGTPTVCQPLWTASALSYAPPTVADGLLHIGNPGSIVAFDAHGEQGCIGTPKVCTPLWQVPAPQFSFSMRTAPTVGPAGMFAMDFDGRLGAYEATASASCSGSPPTCPRRWTGVMLTDEYASSPGYLGWTSPVLAGSRLLVYRMRPLATYPYRRLQLAAFDPNGVEGCRANTDSNLGASTICEPVWTTEPPGSAQNSQLAAAYGMVFAITRTDTGNTGSTDQITAYRVDGAGCAGVPMACPIQWRSTPSLGGNWASPIVANGVVYQGTANGVAAFDATGAGCAPGPCPPVAVVATPPGFQNLAISDGRMYVLTTAASSGYNATTATLTVFR